VIVPSERQRLGKSKRKGTMKLYL